MPFVPVPALIEQSDFTFGWAPDGSTAHRGPGELNDVKNLLLEESTGALVTRDGFARALEELTGDSGRYIVSLHTYRKGSGTKYIIAVTTTGQAAANNVKVYAINVDTWTAARIDTAGRTWSNPTKTHWGVTVDNVFYGGVQGEEFYSWDGTTWDATAATNDWLTAVDQVNTDVTPATEYARDYAYRGNEKVVYGGSNYTPEVGIRYDRWDSGDGYKVGDRVSLKGAWAAAGASYWKSFECIKKHTADSTNKPQLGANTDLYWKKVKLPLPADEDGELNPGWTLILSPPQTSIGQWFANRLWLRGDGYGPKDRLMYSAPVKLEAGEDVTDTVWSPWDWTPGSDMRGDGGGWIAFSDGKHGGPITNLAVYENYLLVFKRQATWVLTGQSSRSFSVRKLANVGAVSPTASVHHEGLLYFLAEDGIYVTDGTTVEAVRGSEKVADYIQARIDITQDDDYAYQPHMWSWGDFVWVSLSAPAQSSYPYLSIAYHPQTGSFWRTTLPVLDTTKVAKDGKQNLYFSTPSNYGLDIVYKYTGSQDDTGVGTQAFVDIPWSLQTAWWPFGLARQDRRIRRAWALVTGAAAYTLKVYRNYNSTTAAQTTARTITGSVPAYVEGEWTPDSHAIMLELSAAAAPSTVHGIAVDTQMRRHSRYHRTPT